MDKFGLISLLMPDNVNLETVLQTKGVGKMIALTDQASCLWTNSEAPYGQGHVAPVKTTTRAITTRNLNAARPLQVSAQQGYHHHQQQQQQPQSSIQDKNRKIILDHLNTNNRPAIHQRLVQRNLTESYAMPTEARTTPPVFKANELPLGTHQVVCCSYIQDGPKLFSIHLKSQESMLLQMMSHLSNVPLRNLSQRPTIGMACVARYSEDRSFYRAVIVNIQPDVCRVTYVDYGNSEDVAYNDIYEIPDKFLEHKTFAIQFGLFGVEQLEPLEQRIKEYFSNLVRDAALEMKVMPLNKQTFVQYCELYYQERSVLHILKQTQTQMNSFPMATVLASGDLVTIRYVKDAKSFHVLRVADKPTYDCMMDKLLMHGPKAMPLEKMPTVGFCCTATWPNDISEWYRVLVLRIVDDKAGRVEVEYVDFGIRAVLSYDKLRWISSEFMVLPRGAIECCLVDFAQVDSVPETTCKQLEMFGEDRKGERKQFRVEAHGSTPDGVALLNLFDDSMSPAANVSKAVYSNTMPRRAFGNANGNANGKPARPTNDADNSASSQSSWSEITATDESNIVAVNAHASRPDAASAGRNGNWNVRRNGAEGDTIDSAKRRQQPFAVRSSTVDSHENNGETRGTIKSHSIDSDTDKMNRGNNRRYERENPDGGQRNGRDGNTENWRSGPGDNNRLVFSVNADQKVCMIL